MYAISFFFKELTFLCPGYERKFLAIPNPNSFVFQKEIRMKKKELLYVGILANNKRVDRIVQIWKRIYKEYPDWSLKIVGDGDPEYVKYLRKKAVTLHRIYFEGFQNPIKYYQSANIFCMTSNYEGWGMVLTEAMQCGVVPVAFNSFASASDIIENGHNGILVKPFNMSAYEKELRQLMEQPSLLKQMSDNAQHDIKRYSIEAVVDMWEKAFEFDNVSH